mmetsp:Transcript_64773/g.146110  ORF Transcript_64773/g.146110 Transcript_64773/m.146110 type:complete len:98 (+) Transcript_64773:909-1202(+)
MWAMGLLASRRVLGPWGISRARVGKELGQLELSGQMPLARPTELIVRSDPVSSRCLEGDEDEDDERKSEGVFDEDKEAEEDVGAEEDNEAEEDVGAE